MQQTVVLGGKTVVVGLSWSVITKAGAARSKDIQKAKEDSGLLNGIVVENAELATVGLGGKKADCNSAAAWAAMAYQEHTKNLSFGDSAAVNSWVIVESVPGPGNEGKYWLCAINDGLPVPGTDMVEDQTVISAKLAELIEILENVDIYSPDKEIQDYVAEVCPAIDKGFAEIAEWAPSYKSKIQKIGGVPDWAIPVAVAASLGVVGYFGWNYYNEHAMREKARTEKLAQEQKKRQDEEQRVVLMNKDYQDKLRLAREKAFGEVEALLRASPKEMTLAWTNAVYALRLNNGGWRLENAACSATDCKIEVSRDGLLATNASLLDELERNGVVKQKSSGIPEDVEVGTDRAAYKVLVTANKKEGDFQKLMDQLPSSDEFIRRTISHLQRLKLVDVDVKISEKTDMTFTPPPPPGVDLAANPEMKPKPIRIGVARGEIMLSGKDLWMAKDLASLLNQPEFSFSSVDVVLSGVSTSPWVIKGSYLVRSARDPMPGEESKDASQQGGVHAPAASKKKDQGWWEKITSFFS